jgi:hypothetical protein
VRFFLNAHAYTVQARCVARGAHVACHWLPTLCFKYGERPAQVYFMVRNVRDLVMNQYLSFSTYPFQKGYPHCAAPAVVRIATRTT